MPRVCIVQTSLNTVSETFIRAHGERLADVVGIIHRKNGLPAIHGRPVLSQNSMARLWRKAGRIAFHRAWDHQVHAGYVVALRRLRPDVVLAEYGLRGAEILPACKTANVPLVVHFHGYDASEHCVLAEYRDAYATMFASAAACIAVSRVMAAKLESIGCPSEKIVYSPYGIDCQHFHGAEPGRRGPRFLAVGRMVEKKAPHLLLLAFQRVLGEVPEATLRIVGDGPYAPMCRDLVHGMRIEHAVTFLGSQSHEVVQREMRNARAFVQHSVTASSGDSEGTPVAILEAGATGLPVIATRHAGIPDVVVEGETGLLVEERDVEGMAGNMLSLARSPDFAADLGQNAAKRVRSYYTMEQSIARLGRILDGAANHRNMTDIKSEIAKDLP